VPRHGHEAIDRYAFRSWIEIRQHLEHLQPVDLAFTHPDDAAAANIHAASWTAAMVFRRSWKVCVVTTFG
jgi:hypothetical protein